MNSLSGPLKWFNATHLSYECTYVYPKLLQAFYPTGPRIEDCKTATQYQDCLGFPSLRRRRNLTSVSKVCKAAPISLLWAPNTQRITGYAFWISFQSDWQIHNGPFWQANITWHVLKSCYTGGGLARTVFLFSLADGLSQSLVSNVAQAKIPLHGTILAR